ncbi:MAG TPA: hypothetical protein VII78_20690 [Myxococcota bacterium]
MLRTISLAALCLASLGCGPRYMRIPLVETPDLTVGLRSETRDGAPVARGFAHPATLSASRAESILSRVDVRETGGDADERRPAIHPDLTRPLAGALSDALGRADSTQEVVLRAQRRERKLGIFTRRFATSFVAFVDAQNRLQLHFVDADRELPAGDDAPIPEPIAGRGTQAVKALPGPHIEALGPRSVAVDWRADAFRSPAARNEPGRRRTILMETAQPDALKVPVDDEAQTTDPERLRALADLEAARRAGKVSEAEYQRRRAELLQAPGT